MGIFACCVIEEFLKTMMQFKNFRRNAALLSLTSLLFSAAMGTAAQAEDSVSSAAASCIAEGGTWDTGSSRFRSGICVSDTQESCAARGGTWKRVCLAQTLQCVMPYSDGGKACTSSSECEGRKCLANYRKEMNEQGREIGQCVSTSDPCGTFRFPGGTTIHAD